MDVNYYGIADCQFDENGQYSPENPPVLVAPANAPKKKLEKHGFQCSMENCWSRIITPEEYQKLMQTPAAQPARIDKKTLQAMSPEEQTKVNRLLTAALLLLLGPFLLSPILTFNFSIWRSSVDSLSFFPIVSFILALYIRIRYPKSKGGKVLFVFELSIFLTIVVALCIFLLILSQGTCRFD